MKIVAYGPGDVRRPERAARWVGLIGLVVLLAATACGARSDTPAETPRVEAAGRLAGGRWSELPDPPLSHRADPAIAWAGDRLVVWGGTDPGPDSPAARVDGATWTPDSGWRSMAPAPANRGLAGGAFAVWTGREVVLGPVVAETGDPAGARLLAYTPASDRWRRILPDPALAATLGDATSGFRGAAAIVGDELLIGRVGGPERAAHPQGRLVAVDPATGRSRPLDPGPFEASPYPDLSGEVLVAPVGDSLLAVPNWTAEAWVLHPSGRGRWTETSPPPVHTLHLNGPVWIGGEAVFPDDSVAFEPATDGWRPLATPPGDLPRLRLDGGSGPIAAGDQAVARGAAYDSRTDVWYPLGPLPLDREEVLLDAFVGWTGDGLVIYGGGRYSCPPNMTCDIQPESVDWSQRGWVYLP